jgi:MarR family transcriptional regulator, organic hydroperoxide resistance regulator
VDIGDLRDAPTGRLLAIAGHVAVRRWRQLLAERHGLTPAGMQVLFALLKEERVSHREMAQRCFVRPATLTGVVDTLAKSGYVERERGAAPDRRAVLLKLTASGKAVATQLSDLAQRRAPLTSVDADPAQEAVIREFLLEIIHTLGAGEEEL